MQQLSDIGLIGIAVMGENLALNMAGKGFSVTVSSRKQETIDAFLNGRAKGLPITGTKDYKVLVESLKKPRKVMMMIKAGDAVDQVISELTPLLEAGDIIIDGGNSLYTDTNRRTESLSEKGIYYIGTGISGGEEGALTGPSIMPGGEPKAWPHIKPIFQKISAQVGNEACCDWVGKNGAGHYVKMVHNGIEYGDIQLINETYHLLKQLLKSSNAEMAQIFKEWNHTELESYLIEITAEIIGFKDEDGSYLIDHILDKAGQKGTGKWTVNAALDLSSPLTLIAESVFARFLSALKDERVVASKAYPKAFEAFKGNKVEFIESLKQALYLAKIISYTQGFALLKEASKEYNWDLQLGNIALLWRGGCIIRSVFLGKIKEAYVNDPKLANLLLDPYFKGVVLQAVPHLRKVVSEAVLNGIPVPTYSAALSYFDAYTTENLPANLLQAQRDYFGAHTYQRNDSDEAFHHTDWTGHGGKTASTTYNV